VSNRSGFIVRGHGRLQAAKLLGCEVVPVDRQDYENEAAEWADLIADNRLSELSTIDNAILKDVLEELDTGALDMELTGFTEDALEGLMSQFHVPDFQPASEDEQGRLDEKAKVICPECGHEFTP
jgi:ParB-like chromosome segregation protein Spo0J